ncbi:MAG: TVP38/TMEM64 family protein [Rhodospirillaceae bacterium]|jgi:uncharacterized membrane protein YdjX (TVP38/TMEM64 family)|nr:TVP38/TMEM64 family protein [Rhodospirillaceae bacterium]
MNSENQTSPDAVEQTKSGKPSIGRLIPLFLLVAGIVAFFVFGGADFLSFDALSKHRTELLQWTEANQALAVVIFIAAYTTVVALSLPGATWMTLGGGFLFGLVGGTIMVVSAATLGAIAIFLIARYALADYFHAKMGASIRKMEAGFQANAMSYLLFLRLVPVFPFWLVNLVPAFLGVPLRTYAIGTFIGILPGSAVYVSVGNGLGAVFDAGGTPDMGIIFKPEILGPIIALALLSLVPIMHKKFKKNKSEEA